MVAKLAREHPDAKIVFTGGSGRFFGGASEADFVARLFESFGVARHRIVLENKARNTIENATLTKALVNPKPQERWLLVTSAHHMPRSVGIFRKAGFPVEAHPVDFRTRGADDLTDLRIDRQRPGADRHCHPRMGRIAGAHWLSGDSSELFPGPQTVRTERADNRRR